MAMAFALALETEMASDSLATSFKLFRDQCIWARICTNTFAALYESGEEPREIMQRTAATFFSDLNRILQEYCLLQFCRLTDADDDLTVGYILRMLRKEGLCTPEIEASAAGMYTYRALIVGARNKIIAHPDRKAALSGVALGAHAEHELADFFDSMFAFVDGVGEAIGIGPLDFRNTPCEGDVLDLLKALGDRAA